MNARVVSALCALATCLIFLSSAVGKTCQVDVGCPKGEPIPQCTQAQKDGATLFGKGISTRKPPKTGARVVYMGILTQGAWCTEKACGQAQCCNRCNGHVSLRGDSGFFGSSPDHYDTVRLTADDANRFETHGDDSLVCRPLALPVQQTVVIDGTFRLKDGQYSIHNPTICQW